MLNVTGIFPSSPARFVTPLHAVHIMPVDSLSTTSWSYFCLCSGTNEVLVLYKCPLLTTCLACTRVTQQPLALQLCGSPLADWTWYSRRRRRRQRLHKFISNLTPPDHVSGQPWIYGAHSTVWLRRYKIPLTRWHRAEKRTREGEVERATIINMIRLLFQ